MFDSSVGIDGIEPSDVEHYLPHLLDYLTGNLTPGLAGVDLNVDEFTDVERPHAELLRVSQSVVVKVENIQLLVDVVVQDMYEYDTQASTFLMLHRLNLSLLRVFLSPA